MSNNKDYMNDYMKKRWVKRRQAAIDYLGGRCQACCSMTGLEFDHIDPETKVMTIARASSRNEKFFWTEVDKCQLLCETCHDEKTTRENEVEHGGGVSGKKNCLCAPCKAKKSEYNRNYKLQRASS